MLVLCVVGKVDKCRINESNKIGATLSIKSYEADGCEGIASARPLRSARWISGRSVLSGYLMDT